MEIHATGVPAPSWDPPTPGGVAGRLLPDAASKPAPTLDQAISRANAAARDAGKAITFVMDSELNKVVVRVIDGNTNEVIRQMPSEEMVEISKSIRDMQGLLLRIRA
ncbi:MAG: flagellar protein FlaG [Burkholderiales bacterium]|nr:flagellar protein FlaG [Burkholderiales bacterium]